ncbi:MAG: hypothetical protein LAT68_01540 [Cyclobacteriaceae bacterium]|nr:hypothetical protein [Cyclobacteriaceae bacterium]MCH8514986.1 hypothetical protein [Cyclobacteriaceae bacterium]
MKTLLYEHENLKIFKVAVDSFEYFHEEWSGMSTSDHFKGLIYESLAVYSKHFDGFRFYKNNKCLLLADVSLHEIVKKEDMAWLAEEINPKYEALGFTHQALLMPLSFIGQMNVKKYEDLSTQIQLKTVMLNTENEALEWFLRETE